MAYATVTLFAPFLWCSVCVFTSVCLSPLCFPSQFTFKYQIWDGVSRKPVKTHKSKSRDKKGSWIHAICFVVKTIRDEHCSLTCYIYIKKIYPKNIEPWVSFQLRLPAACIVTDKTQPLTFFLYNSLLLLGVWYTLAFPHVDGLLCSIAEQIAQSVGCRLNLLMTVCGVNILLLLFPTKWKETYNAHTLRPKNGDNVDYKKEKIVLHPSLNKSKLLNTCEWQKSSDWWCTESAQSLVCWRLYV